MAVAKKIHMAAHAFDLKDVRITGGPFKHAMDLNKAYLLELEPDRLLARFREYAGLQPKASQYEGWETMSLSGHTLGHYLSACSMMYAATDDMRFKERVDYIVAELKECQSAHGDGYVSGIPRGKEMFMEVSRGEIRSKGFDLNETWAPLYTIHKLLAGLRDAYRLTGNAEALDVERGLADWLLRIFARLTDEQMQEVMRCEYGGINEVLADLYEDTGNEAYLQLADRFWHKQVLDPLSRKEDNLSGKHANTQIPKLIGLAKQYELTGEEKKKETAQFFWERVVYHHSYVTGGNSFGEYFADPDVLNDRIGPHTTETCNTYNMLKLTKHLFQWNGSAQAADYYERALFNHILASQDPHEGRVCYFVSLAMGGHKDYNRKFDDFTCCVGTGMENHAGYGSGIYYHHGDRLFVSQFIASTLHWAEKNVTLTQETDYPEDETTLLKVNCAAPTPFAMCIRYPSWADKGIEIKINGEVYEVTAKKGSFVEIDRVWKDGDQVQVTIPMELRLESMPDNPDRVAVMYGPLVLAGDLGPLDDPNAKSHLFTPVFLAKHQPLSEWLKPIPGQSATFRTEGIGYPRDVTLYPFYRMHHRMYSVYWDLFTKEEWAEAERQYRDARERMLLLEECTVDFAQPGEMQPERDHNFQANDAARVDELYSRPCRVAGIDGWFSFDMKVRPGSDMLLVATYTFVKEMDNVAFDVFADGVFLEEREGFQETGKFYNVHFRLPGEVVEGKESVTILFKARPGCRVRRVFGLRVVDAAKYEQLAKQSE